MKKIILTLLCTLLISVSSAKPAVNKEEEEAVKNIRARFTEIQNGTYDTFESKEKVKPKAGKNYSYQEHFTEEYAEVVETFYKKDTGQLIKYQSVASTPDMKTTMQYFFTDTNPPEIAFIFFQNEERNTTGNVTNKIEDRYYFKKNAKGKMELIRWISTGNKTMPKNKNFLMKQSDLLQGVQTRLDELK